MGKQLVSVLLLGALIACETKTPLGPSGVTPTTSTTTTSSPTTAPTTTTTTIPVITSLARSFKAFPPPPANQPSEMTLFFKLIAALPVSALTVEGVTASANGDHRYIVSGVYVMPNGTTGIVDGELTGVNPLENGGTYNGHLTAKTPSGCTAERNFTGSLNPQDLSLTGVGTGPSTCSPSPLGTFNTISMLLSDPSAPLPTVPTTSSTSTTTSILPTTTTSSTILTTTPSTTTTSVCAYSFTPPSPVSVGAAGGAQSVNVTTQVGCALTAQSFDSWITVTSPAGGTGSGAVTYTVTANTGPARRGRLVISSNDYFVDQAAGVPDLTYASPVPVSCTVTPGSPFDTLTVAIKVRNIGSGDAGVSNTRVTFTVFSTVPTIVVTTPTGAIAAGAATGTPSSPDPTFTINDADVCYADTDEDGTEICNFSVTVDALGAVSESDESATSNTVAGQCSRPVPGSEAIRRGVRR